MGLFP